MSLIQRDGRPALSISPDETPNTASWETQYNEPMNPLNAPVDVRKGKAPDNGWLTVASDIVSDSDDFSKGSGGEKR